MIYTKQLLVFSDGYISFLVSIFEYYFMIYYKVTSIVVLLIRDVPGSMLERAEDVLSI